MGQDQYRAGVSDQANSGIITVFNGPCLFPGICFRDLARNFDLRALRLIIIH